MADTFAYAAFGRDGELLGYGELPDEVRLSIINYYGNADDILEWQEFTEGDEKDFVEFLHDNNKIRMQNDAQFYVDWADASNVSLLDIETWERSADEKYRGHYRTAAEFAESYAEEIAEARIDWDNWPMTLIDWEKAAEELLNGVSDVTYSDNGYAWNNY